jgi:hypothetical protein
MCLLGERISDVRRRLDILPSPRQRGEETSGRETEYTISSTPIHIDGVDYGAGVIVARISLDFRAFANRATNGFSIRTAHGVELAPDVTRKLVVAAYGEPKLRVASLSDPSLPRVISEGQSYAVKESELTEFEYLHYPNLGIAFVFEKDELLKCSLEVPRKRVVWRY